MPREKKVQLISLGLIGKNIAHSKSPEIYQKLLGKISYKLFDYPNINSLPTLPDLFHKHCLQGLNVTAPYKEHFCDQVVIEDPEIKNLNLINCIKRKNGEFFATNTDLLAVRSIISELVEQNHRLFVLLGNGAMAKITLHILEQFSQNKKVNYEHYYREKNRPLERLNLQQKFDRQRVVIINSCSRQFVFEGLVPEDALFWDYNYSHLAHQNRFKGCRYWDGHRLLLLQGMGAIDFFQIET